MRPGRWRGVEISLGVLESSLFVLEEEGLEVGVSSPEAFGGGHREEAHLCGQNWGLRLQGDFQGL